MAPDDQRQPTRVHGLFFGRGPRGYRFVSLDLFEGQIQLRAL